MTKTRFTFLVLLLQFFAIAAFAQHDYFADIDGVKGGADMKNALYNIIKEHKRISYGKGEDKTWGAFYTTDAVVENGKRRVLDMYSNEKRYFGNKGSAVGGMNIEHSVAKSWWGGTTNNAYCDLHHLNPSDQNANSRKSNYPLGELTSVTWDNGVTFVGKANIDGSTQNAYEPCDEYKGDFARVFMYMFTCYQDLTWEHTWMNYEKSAYPTLKPWAVELLLKWHKQDPVSEKEINRNNAVFAIQGNRNPYVDYPQLADYVWGDSINYIFKLTGGVEVGTGGTGNTESTVDGWRTCLNENFNSEINVFTTSETIGEFPWKVDTKNNRTYAVATSYVSEDKTNNDAESWLISPYIDFSNDSIAKISFDYVIRYCTTGKESEYHKLLISKDYTGSVSNATWESIDFAAAANSTDWTFTKVTDLNLPEKYMGESNVTIAFYYKGTSSKAGTFEVDDVIVQATTGGNNDNSTPDGDGNGDNNEGGDNDGDDNEGGGDNKDEDDNENIPDIENNGYFTLVTSATQMAEGDTIIIAYEDKVMADQTNNYRNKIDGLVVSGNYVTSIPEGTQKVVLEKGTKDETFAFNVGTGYLAAVSSSSNYVRTIESITDDASWTIAIENGFAVVTAQGTYTRKILQYNTSSPRFSCYTGTQKSVNIYIKKPQSTTAIENTEAKEKDFEVYSITGIHIRTATGKANATNGLEKGLYIINGEKVIIK